MLFGKKHTYSEHTPSWDTTHNPHYKNTLLTYNAEDCRALQLLVVLENSNMAQLASNPYPQVHSRSKEDRHDTDDASSGKIYDIFVP